MYNNFIPILNCSICKENKPLLFNGFCDENCFEINKKMKESSYLWRYPNNIRRCEYCTKKFIYERSKRKCCSNVCARKLLQKTNKRKTKYNCIICNNFFYRIKKHQKICSNKCHKIFLENSKKQKGLKISKALKKPDNLKNKRIYLITCIGCKTQKHTKTKNQKFCSIQCAGKYFHLKKPPITPYGGYHPGSERSHHGYYKGYYCGSTYELAFVIYNIDHNVSFKRFEGYVLREDNKKYFPDYKIDNTIHEMKGGYEAKETTAIKIKAAKNAGYEIKIWYKEDLTPYFEYVKNKYQVKKIEELFEGYSKPVYNYTCNGCGIIFQTENKSKNRSKKVYCKTSCFYEKRSKEKLLIKQNKLLYETAKLPSSII